MTNAPSAGIVGVSSIRYAPRSWVIFTWNAVILPSLVAPMRMSAVCARPWWQTAMCSERVSIHLTGRWSLRETQENRASSPVIWSLAPKPPPTSGAMTRTRSSLIPSIRPRNRRTKCGTCVEVWIVRCPAR